MRLGDLVDLALGLCALVYSFMPADRVPSYRRGVALLMRFVGVVLVLIAGSNLLLAMRPADRGRSGTSAPVSP